MSLLRLSGVSHTYGSGRRRSTALRAVSFAGAPGEVIGVVGPNGAGKTTLLRLIAGDLIPTSGEISLAGARPGTRTGRRQVGFASDPPLAPPELTGGEWLSYLASHRAGSPSEGLRLVRAAVEVGQLEAFVGRRIADYSRGMGQRLAVAAAYISAGPIVVLDEVLSGVDPLVQRHLRGQIAGIAALRKLVVIASHDLAAVERLATRVLVLFDGRLVADVATAALLLERVLELSFNGTTLASADRLFRRYPEAMRTGEGVAVP
ncbi:MAG: ABC transporter ATP-binding protein, partial [Gemmatimonadales bacterium]